MNVIIIDDEMPSIERLSFLIKQDGRLDIVNTFTDANSALEYLKQNSVDIVFSDIDMPEMNGITFGKKLLEYSPHTILVYITAYGEYALEAFSNYAMGYLLKPISLNTLSKLLTKLLPSPQKSVNPITIKVKTLGDFSLSYGDTPIKFRTKKAKELFCFLLHHEHAWVSSDKIMYALWQDKPSNLARTHLHTCLSYCRKAFKDVGLNNIIEYDLSSYRINLSKVWWDYSVLKNKIDSLKDTNIKKDDLIEIFRLDQGMYLSDNDYLWAHDARALLDIELYGLYEKQAKNPELSKEERVKIQTFITNRQSLQ